MCTVPFDAGLKCGDDGLEPCSYSDPDTIAAIEGDVDIVLDHGEIRIGRIGADINPEFTGPFRDALVEFLMNDASFMDRAEQLAAEADSLAAELAAYPSLRGDYD